MKNLSNLVAVLLLSIVLFASCKKQSSTQAKYIPKNASGVLVINMAGLKDKLMENQASLAQIVANMASKSDTAITKVGSEWMALQSSGIDFNDKLMVYTANSNNAFNTDTLVIANTVAAVALLKDGLELQTYLQQKFKASKVEKEADFSYLAAEGDKIFGWNKEVVVMMYYQQPATVSMMYDSTTSNFNLGAPANKTAELKSALTAMFALKQSESLADMAGFNDLLTEKADAYAWANASEAQQNMPLQLPKLNELLSNTYTAATIGFNAGEVVVNSRTYNSDALRDILKKYAGPKVDLSLVEKLPAGNINAYMVFAFDPQIFNGVAQYAQAGGFVDGVISKFMGTTFTLQNVLSAIKGDVGVVVADAGIATVDSTVPAFPLSMVPKAKLIFTLPMGDETKSAEILDKFVANGSLRKVNGNYTVDGIMGTVPMALSISNKNLVFASDSAVLNSYLSGSGGSTIAADVKEGLSDKAGVMYINLQSIFNGVSAAQNRNVDPAMTMAKNTFKDVKATLSNYNGKYIEGQLQVRMMDTKTNAFTTLVKLAADASNQAKLKRAAAENEVTIR